MKKFLKYIIINGLFATSVYYGYFENVLGAERIAVFVVWFTFFLSLFFFTGTVQKRMKEKGRSAPEWIDVPFNLMILSVFVWFGSWVTGTAYFIHILIHKAAWSTALTSDETK